MAEALTAESKDGEITLYPTIMAPNTWFHLFISIDSKGGNPQRIGSFKTDEYGKVRPYTEHRDTETWEKR